MKKLYYYSISKEQLDNTEYRPLGVETDYFEAEDDWSLEDIIHNDTSMIEDFDDIELIAECGDINVYKITQTDDWETDEPRYFGMVEIIDHKAFYECMRVS